MVLVGETVPHRHPGVTGKLLDRALPVSPVLDSVVEPPEHPGGVAHGFLRAEVRPRAVDEGGAGPLVRRRDLERAARAGGALLEDECNVAPLEAPALGTLALLALEPVGEIEDVGDLPGRVVAYAKEAAIREVYGHGIRARSLRRAMFSTVAGRHQGRGTGDA